MFSQLLFVLAIISLAHGHLAPLVYSKANNVEYLENRYIVVFKNDTPSHTFQKHLLFTKSAVGDHNIRHVYKTALTGFSSKLTSDQLLEIRRNPHVKYDSFVIIHFSCYLLKSCTNAILRLFFSNHIKNLTKNSFFSLLKQQVCRTRFNRENFKHPTTNLFTRRSCFLGTNKNFSRSMVFSYFFCLADIFGSYYLQQIHLDGTYSAPGSAGEGVTAYIVDTGIYTQNEDFEGYYKFFNFFSLLFIYHCLGRAKFGFKASPSWSNTDSNGHGTHVASTVGGKLHGIAKRVDLVAVKVLGDDGSGTNSGVIAGIEYVACMHIYLAFFSTSLFEMISLHSFSLYILFLLLTRNFHLKLFSFIISILIFLFFLIFAS